MILPASIHIIPSSFKEKQSFIEYPECFGPTPTEKSFRNILLLKDVTTMADPKQILFGTGESLDI